jgi:hypothetical protein
LWKCFQGMEAISKLQEDLVDVTVLAVNWGSNVVLPSETSRRSLNE